MQSAADASSNGHVLISTSRYLVVCVHCPGSMQERSPPECHSGLPPKQTGTHKSQRAMIGHSLPQKCVYKCIGSGRWYIAAVFPGQQTTSDMFQLLAVSLGIAGMQWHMPSAV